MAIAGVGLVGMPNELHPPGQPGRSGQSARLPQNCIKSDSVLFSGAKAPDFSIDDVVTDIQPKYISPAFLKNAKQGAQQALMSLPKSLRQDILKEGLQVLVVPMPLFALEDERCYQRAERIVRKQAVNEILQSRQDPEKQRAIYQEIAQNVRALPDGPLKNKLNQLINADMPFSQKCSELLVVHKMIVLINRFEGAGLFGNQIIVPEKKYLDSDQMHPTALLHEREMRHELMHFVDMVLGAKLTGRYFSSDTRFRTAILQDSLRAKNNKSWPELDQLTEIGFNLNHYYLRGADSEQNYLEAFAEAGSRYYGGGAVPAELMRRTYIESAKYVRELIERYWGTE